MSIYNLFLKCNGLTDLDHSHRQPNFHSKGLVVTSRVG